MNEVSILLSVLLFLSCLAISIVRAVKYARLELLDWSFLAIGAGYGIGWVIVLTDSISNTNNYWRSWILPNSDLYLIHTLCVMVLLAAIWVGWHLMSLSSWIRHSTVKNVAGNIISTNKTAVIAWIILGSAILLQWLYTRAYGGFFGIFEYSRALRSGILLINNSFSFLQPFGTLSLISSFIFFGLILSRRKKYFVSFGLLISFFFSLYILYSRQGRIGFLIYISTFALGYAFHRRIRPIALLAGTGILLLGVLIAAYILTITLNLHQTSSLTSFLAKELAFPFVSFFAQINSGEHLHRGFIDFLVTPLYFLPSSFWAGMVDNATEINTTVIIGASKGQDGVTGGIPVDLLTLGVMQFSSIGILLTGMLYGCLLRALQSLLKRISIPGLRVTFEAFIIFRIAIFAVFYAHPAHVVAACFGLCITAVIMYISNKRYKYGHTIITAQIQHK